MNSAAVLISGSLDLSELSLCGNDITELDSMQNKSEKIPDSDAYSTKKKRGLTIEGYPIEGLSIGGQETCIIFPTLKLAFDIGRCPQRAISQDFLFISHGHMDHIGGLPMYVATRSLYSMKPPTVIVPAAIKESVEKLFEAHRTMDQSELKHNLIGLNVGEEIVIRKDLKVRAFKTYHVIPSQFEYPYEDRGSHGPGPDSAYWFKVTKIITLTYGSVNCEGSRVRTEVQEGFSALGFWMLHELRYAMECRGVWVLSYAPLSTGYVVYSVRLKLKQEYLGLSGDEIKNLRLSGVEVCLHSCLNKYTHREGNLYYYTSIPCDLLLVLAQVFTGNGLMPSLILVYGMVRVISLAYTMSDFIVDQTNADVLKAKILVMESTFVDNAMSVEHARDYGHTHLSEIVENAARLENKAILLTHFSARYRPEEIEEAVAALPPPLAGRIFALTEGF
ncbi:Metallo-beta-lactamase [Dillenia turbinata]|uniref:Metallo-beta-lactamase n=1 Tax=Dillenia turbinata TaxID=194707 RepID=A0AAN8URV6_9MAGN